MKYSLWIEKKKEYLQSETYKNGTFVTYKKKKKEQ